MMCLDLTKPCTWTWWWIGLALKSGVVARLLLNLILGPGRPAPFVPQPTAVAGGRRCNENACMAPGRRPPGGSEQQLQLQTNQRSIIYHLSINHVLCDRLVSCWAIHAPSMFFIIYISLWWILVLVLVVLATTCMVAWFDVGVWKDSPELDGSIRPPHACVLVNLND
jgi:hypothetical protein